MNEFYFQRVTECLITMHKYEEAKDLVQAEIKKKPEVISLLVTLGSLYDRMNEGEDAKSNIQQPSTDWINSRKVPMNWQGLSLVTPFSQAIEAYERVVK